MRNGGGDVDGGGCDAQSSCRHPGARLERIPYDQAPPPGDRSSQRIGYSGEQDAQPQRMRLRDGVEVVCCLGIRVFQYAATKVDVAATNVRQQV